ncbi:MAG: tetratricopeptide repeat protein, partial [Lachnospiraceae bacterium]|nr:tetratricopeptide repeat protein [Lachnospiraceae bacterium]
MGIRLNRKNGVRRFLIQLITATLLIVFSGCGKRGAGSGVEEGMQYIAAMNYSAALDSFTAAEASGEDARLIARGRGIACIGLTDYEAAVENLLLCLSLSDGIVTDMDYDVNYYLAAAYQKLGRYQDAEAVYNAILALRPGEADAYYLRGNARLSQGQFETAKEDFDAAIRLDPSDFARLIQVY